MTKNLRMALAGTIILAVSSITYLFLWDKHHDAVFAEIYGIDFNVVIQEFKAHVMQSTP